MIKAESSSLLYVIISIVLLIISAVGKNKNKKQTVTQPQTEENPNPQPTWQRELEDVFGKMVEEEQEPEKAYPKKEVWNTEFEPVKQLGYELSPVQSNYQEEVSKPFQELSVSSDTPVTKLTGEPLTGVIINLDENEIRKAIIYSEILNRKYF